MNGMMGMSGLHPSSAGLIGNPAAMAQASGQVDQAQKTSSPLDLELARLDGQIECLITLTKRLQERLVYVCASVSMSISEIDSKDEFISSPLVGALRQDGENLNDVERRLQHILNTLDI